MPKKPVPLAAGLVVPGLVELAGYSVAETTKTTDAQVTFRDGSSTGTILEIVTLNPNESRSESWEDGVLAEDGIFVEITGTVTGSIRLGGS
jgi:hypothetical protein